MKSHRHSHFIPPKCPPRLRFRSILKPLLEGEWAGSYTHEEWVKGVVEETHFTILFTILSTFITSLPSNRLQFNGAGKDLYGKFEIHGQLNGRGVYFVKLYEKVWWLYARGFNKDVERKEVMMKGH